MSDNAGNLDWRKPGQGLFPLQHSNYDQSGGGFDLDFRSFVAAWRIAGRVDSGSSGLGHWKHDPETPGDIIGGMVWNVDRSRRPIPAWAFAWPVVKFPAGGGTATVSARPSGGCVPLVNDGMLPVNGENMFPDTRFVPVAPVRRGVDDFGNVLLAKMPLGMYGVGLMATEERQQIEYCFQADGRIVSPNFAGDNECGTIVTDLDISSRIDPKRYGRMQSLAWVIKNPQSNIGGLTFFGRNMIAWNIGPSGCAYVHGGGMIDAPNLNIDTNFVTDGIPFFGTPTDRVIGMTSRRQGGFVDVGSVGGGDKHILGADADFHPIESNHLSDLSLFRRDDFFDGPLDLEGYYPPAIEPSGQEVRVHCAFDSIGFLTPASYPWMGTTLSGKWRWYVRMPLHDVTDGGD